MLQPTRLVVGLGNPLAGSDGFGSAVVARLRERDDLPGDVALVDAGTDLLGHLDSLASYDEVVLVDAVVGAGGAGEILVVDESTFKTWPETTASSHALSPHVAVKLFRTLYPQAATRIVLVGLSVDAITLGEDLPAAVVTAGADAVARQLGLPPDP